ncbi:MAG: holo-ACP synthase [Gammaproteobacteria bacterium]
MRIVGTGIDIVEIARIAESLEKFSISFAEKILHSEELSEYENSKNKAAFLAKRFAIKEAFAKAMGTGIRDHVHWQVMHVQHDNKGKPSLVFTKDFAEKIHAENLDVHISVSDEKKYVVAQALIVENLS